MCEPHPDNNRLALYKYSCIVIFNDNLIQRNSTNEVFLSTAITLSLAFPALADPKTDIDYIVKQTLTRNIFEGAVMAQRELLVSAIENEMRKNDLRISDPDAFFDIFIDEWIEEFTTGMQAQTGVIYRNMFSDQELADIADFYRTDSGKALIQKTPLLMQAGANLGRKVGVTTSQTVNKRLAARLRAENVIIDSPSATEKILELLE